MKPWNELTIKKCGHSRIQCFISLPGSLILLYRLCYVRPFIWITAYHCTFDYDRRQQLLFSLNAAVLQNALVLRNSGKQEPNAQNCHLPFTKCQWSQVKPKVFFLRKKLIRTYGTRFSWENIFTIQVRKTCRVKLHIKFRFGLVTMTTEERFYPVSHNWWSTGKIYTSKTSLKVTT